MSERARFEHSVRVAHRGRRCATCTQFYTDSEGEVHPIRSSPGYDPEVEKVQREHRERRRLTAMYGHERTEKGKRSAVVERPPWAAGIPDRHLIVMARAHGVNAGMPLWWERVGLEGSVRADPTRGQKAAKASGELRYALEGRSSFDRRRDVDVDQAERELAEMSPRERRAFLARDRAIQAKVHEDLPW